MLNHARWKKGNKIVYGWYVYLRSSDSFSITLAQRNETTGEPCQRFEVGSDDVSFNGWTLDRDYDPHAPGSYHVEHGLTKAISNQGT